MTGSSPLTRGKLGVGVGDVGDGGLIPAHAGKTAHGAGPALSGRAHPRSRGENGTQVLAGHLFSGSSPLTRGKLNRLVRAVEPEGLIPAHAGKTLLHEQYGGVY